MADKNTNITEIKETDATLVSVLNGDENLTTDIAASPVDDTSEAAPPSAGQDLPLIKTDTALRSLRASNFDTPAAVGEPIDNSIQSGAHNVRIRLVEGERKLGKKAKSTLVVEEIAIADDGAGMPADVLARSLILGYSSRYNNRNGMGRFGVGSTLAGISQAERLELYTRDSVGGPYLYSYIDLEEISDGKQLHMPVPVSKAIPKKFADMMGSGTGTLVVWSKCDRLVQGDDGTVHDFTSVRNDLRTWISRTYRYFLDGGVRIELDGQSIEPHDPLFLMDVPRFSADPKSEVLHDETFEWPLPSEPTRTSPIRVRITLLPKEWRLRRYMGNPTTNTQTRERQIDQNEGFSILRSKREIFYGVSQNFYKGGREAIDRWHGIEILFEPELDECFRVKNVKKGAEPVDNLRAKLKGIIDPVVKVARKRILATYEETDSKEKAASGVHEEAENIGADVDKASPKSRSGKNSSPEKDREKIDQATAAAAESTPGDGLTEEQIEAIRERLTKMPLSMIDTQWPGKEFIDIDHLGANVVIKLNNRHPFFTDIYGPVLRAAGLLTPADNTGEAVALSEEELRRIARAVHTGLDLMIMAYAKAESMDEDAHEKYAELRMYWGLFLSKYIEKRRSDQ